MKRVNLNPARLICLLALILSLTTAMRSKPFQLGRYKQSNLGQICFDYTTAPATCTTDNTGVICTTLVGSATRTWYVDACVTPYYKLP